MIVRNNEIISLIDKNIETISSVTELFPSFIDRPTLDFHAPNDYLTLPTLTSNVDTNQYESSFNLAENSDSVLTANNGLSWLV